MALLPVPSGQSQRGSVSKLGSSHCLWAAIFDDMLWMRPPGALLCAQTSPQGRKRLRTFRGTSRFSEPWELETLGHPLLLWVRVRVVELRLNKPKACAQSQRAWPGIRDVSPGSDSLGHDGVQRLYSHVGELCLSHHTDFSRGRSGGLGFPSLSEFSTVYCDPHSQRLWQSQ